MAFMDGTSRMLPLAAEFFRYCLVGGTAFIIDISILYAARTFFFAALGDGGILLATALGFLAGLVFNYVLSFIFVFKQIDKNEKRWKTSSFLIFAIIGIIGLLITELGMVVGIRLLGQAWYLAVKIVIAGIVLLWNYIARKTILFKGVRNPVKEA